MDIDPVIDNQTANYIVLALGTCKQQEFSVLNWKIKFGGIGYEIFPKNIIDFGDRVKHIRNIFIDKKIADVISQIISSSIDSDIRMMIVDHLTMILSNKNMSKEMNEMKKRVDDLNDKISILIDVLQLNNSK